MAHDRLIQRVRMGAQQQQAVLEAVTEMVIVDRLFFAQEMGFGLDPHDKGLRILYEKKPDVLRVHSHALGQLAGMADSKCTSFIRGLVDGNEDERMLAKDILNRLYRIREFVYSRGPKEGMAKRFLHRYVGDTLRGFLTASYNPKLSSANLLRPFVETCAEFGAGPVEARSTDIRVTLKCIMPHVFEPVRGEFVAFGSSFSNSDFGAGALNISLSVMRISSGSISVLERGYKRVHIGRVLDDSDIDIDNEMAQKELEAQQMAVRKAVQSQLDVNSIETFLNAIKIAAEHEIKWYALKDHLRKVLRTKELSIVEQMLLSGGSDIIDLPVTARDESQKPVATKWWAANVLGWMASKEDDPERGKRMQALAGDLIGVKQEAA
jgi:hypothetical protein